MAASSSLGKILEGYGTASHYRPKKSYIHDYEGAQHGDIMRQYSANPYGGDDLGFTKNQIEGRMGEGVDESQAEFKSDTGALERSAAGNNARPLSGAYQRAKQRALEAHLARSSDIRRRNLILDAVQRREDFDNRLRRTSGALAQGTGLYNAYADQATKRRGGVYGGVGDLITDAATYGTGSSFQSAFKGQGQGQGQGQA